MVYNQFSDTQANSKVPTNETETTDKFTPLLPKRDGNGPYHFNHFIRFIKIKYDSSDIHPDLISKILTKWFYDNFNVTFSNLNIASVTDGVGDFANSHFRPTKEFVIGGNQGDLDHRIMGTIHPDWVAMNVSDTSFSGQTISRNFNTIFENHLEKDWPTFQYYMKTMVIENLRVDKYDPESPLKSVFVWFLIDIMIKGYKSPFLKFFDLNRKHFLSGMRSWRVGFDKNFPEYFFFETVAIERYSDKIYSLMDNYFLNKLHDLRKDIVRLWANHLNNAAELVFKATFPQFKIIDATPARRVDYRNIEMQKGYKHSGDETHCFYRQESYPVNGIQENIKYEKRNLDIVKNHLFLFNNLKNC